MVVGPRVRREDLPSETPETPPARQNWRVTGRDGIGHWSKLERVDRGPGRTPLKVVLSSGAEVIVNAKGSDSAIVTLVLPVGSLVSTMQKRVKSKS